MNTSHINPRIRRSSSVKQPWSPFTMKCLQSTLVWEGTYCRNKKSPCARNLLGEHRFRCLDFLCPLSLGFARPIRRHAALALSYFLLFRSLFCKHCLDPVFSACDWLNEGRGLYSDFSDFLRDLIAEAHCRCHIKW